jgi:hypothetical protein
MVRIANQYEGTPIICQTAGQTGWLPLLPALAYPTFQGNANAKCHFLTPVKMLDCEIPL